MSCSLDGLGAVVVFRFRWSVGGLESSCSPSVKNTSLDSFETISEGLRESGLEDGVGWSAIFMMIIRTLGFLLGFLLKCTGTSILRAMVGASMAVLVLASALGRLPAYLD